MISWFLYINNNKEAIELKTDELIEIKETDRLFFVVKIKRNILDEVGYPILLLGDIPVVFDDEDYIDNDAIFKSQKSEDINQLRYFYNFFGESEAKLSFQKDDEKSIKLKFNILARKENAILAKQMLDYLTDRIDDAIFICFSRSSIHGTSSDRENFNFNKFNLIEKVVDFLRENICLFVRENKHTWQTDIILSKVGQPTGADSVYWVLSNLDKITLNNGDNVNVFYNNRGYSLSLIPKEIIKKQTDTYENRVIKSFLYHAEDFLNKLKNNILILIVVF
ncbi:DUF2357 domain-containing protein [Arsenophonus nasoniae]|uniref:Uncharacterized protein n=1 Tax=Arsenophonus nasoniae TaxID=638 RepID=A0A4P7L1X1_9GAMM|nr:DUF2357 domain-containing protein [Arsenophonus nasoniae]QBY45110.1 hypothetical protein ArsFIN_37030 [Arsenophonus nasoniae]WGM10321.1 DUF2357 domain-containing protein [Arsenophonus nasoniae]WGM15036.1 DUF2357 domain-containing protein [Arsenophonus nasoniae]